MAASTPRLLSTVVLSLLSSVAIAQQQDPANSAPKDGFLTGLSGFEKLHEPIGQPLYFESPTIETSLRPIYLRHNFDDASALGGGNVTVYAAQLRLALSDRWAFIATKDGYSELNTGAFGEDEGWNDLAGGLKYAAIVDQPKQFLVSAGLRYQAENGHRGVLQGGVDEFSPFVSAAKGYDDLHVVAGTCWRVPTDSNDGNQVLHWDFHVDYDLNPDSDRIVSPVAEIHGVHYLDSGATALPVGGLDYTNLGSQVGGEFVSWAGLGLRLEVMRKVEIGAVYEFALTDSKDDIMDDRVTVDMIFRW
ncbi:MAG: hypothetical protein ABL997_10100 [Planctomycetota bacterium]